MALENGPAQIIEASPMVADSADTVVGEDDWFSEISRGALVTQRLYLPIGALVVG